MRGLFVALEGIDGSGKSSLLAQLIDQLNELGYKVIGTQEPTDSDLGKLLRIYLSDPKTVPESDALLFAADRVEHYYQFIKPFLDKGYIVISDRYKLSSIVYQGSQNVEESWIKEINRKSADPDLTIYLKISIRTALERLAESDRENIEKFENKEYLSTIFSRYEKLVEETNAITVNAEKSFSEVLEEVIEHIKMQL